jgi:hypothetical protein
MGRIYTDFLKIYCALSVIIRPSVDCRDAGGRAPKLGALGDAGAIAEFYFLFC